MLNKIKIWSGVVALIIAFIALSLSYKATLKVSAPLGGVTNYDNLTLTTSNTATSSLLVGCIQMNATSTASPGRLLFNTQATTTISGTAAGTVAWGYGTCPF